MSENLGHDALTFSGAEFFQDHKVRPYFYERFFKSIFRSLKWVAIHRISDSGWEVMPHNFKRIARSLLLVLAVCLAGTASADTGVIHKKNATIYTGNFAVTEKNAASAVVQSPEDSIGILGDYAVVSGEKNPHHLAYVRKNNGQGYLILDRIYVKCARKTPCEIPEEYRAVKLSSRLYEVPVSDYESWQTALRELRKLSGVIKVSASYSYGIKPVLR